MRNGRLHGGLRTGPRTPEGLERLRKARTIHGFYCREVIEERRETRRQWGLLRELLRSELVSYL
jgi:hypothetical protein